ncbi:hypothetical protein K5I29_09760 [Flavobacterium agricola]|uniref:Uncharacterized protein n=1 Tax=Flavobacterium agricola TaxID=2870839 RepID=A0ABY6M1N6_9FLAO|nr:hypothetical protein [Flavobacterium agricola]UYW00788.1 hypothetical protein K5I29_09760 [Flavobacterium agricola]
MSKILQFLNKYLLVFILVAYFLNKYANPDLESQRITLIVLVVVMFLNLILKFYFLKQNDKAQGTNRVRGGLILMAVAFVLLFVYVYFRGVFN